MEELKKDRIIHLPSFFISTAQLCSRCSALWPHAMEIQVCQNGDPIFSEMGTKWGPSATEWGPKKPMFAKLIETS